MFKRLAVHVRALDGILRGEATRLSAIREGSIDVSVGGLTVVLVALAMVYGVCMGLFSLLKGDGPIYYMQIVATSLKVPALFFLTLVVTFPSLYVFNALVGSRLNLRSVLQLLIAALGVNLAVLASLGPIVAFFSVSTPDYNFMVLLNVVVFAVSGLLGLAFLLQTLHRLSIADEKKRSEDRIRPPSEMKSEHAAVEEEPVDIEVADREPGALDRLEGHVLGRHVKTVFKIWIVVFGLVGAQMGWVLRPFIGDPDLPFEWFRQRQSNFFEAVIESLKALFL